LCGALETDLRLQVHSHLQLDDSNPFRQGIKTLNSFLLLPMIPFFNKEIDIKGNLRLG
jgi:WASH complex subunit 7